MNIERPGSPSATTVAPTSKRRSTSIETRRSRLASESPPKKGVATKNAFRSGELTVIRTSRTRNLTAPYRLPEHPRRSGVHVTHGSLHLLTSGYVWHEPANRACARRVGSRGRVGKHALDQSVTGFDRWR